MNPKSDKWFFNFSGATLLLTSLAKLYSAAGHAKVLAVQDQLLHLGYRPLMILTATVEVAVAVFLFKGRSDVRRCLVLLWLSGNFLFYHLGNYLLGVQLCPCLGQLTERLPLPKGLAELVFQFLALYWFLTSLNMLWREWGSAQWALLFSPMKKPSRTSSPRLNACPHAALRL